MKQEEPELLTDSLVVQEPKEPKVKAKEGKKENDVQRLARQSKPLVFI